MKVYCLLLENSEWQKSEIELLNRLPRERKNKALRHRNVMDQKKSMYGALLVCVGAKNHLRTQQSIFSFSESALGKPYLSEYPAVNFNLSHSSNVVICGFSSRSIGVDVEKIVAVYDDVIERCFHEDEKIAFRNSSQKERLFYRIWTRKEARVKCEGNGILGDLKAVNTYQLNSCSRYHSWADGDYYYAVYSDEKATPFELFHVTPADIYRRINEE